MDFFLYGKLKKEIEKLRMMHADMHEHGDRFSKGNDFVFGPRPFN